MTSRIQLDPGLEEECEPGSYKVSSVGNKSHFFVIKLNWQGYFRTEIISKDSENLIGKSFVAGLTFDVGRQSFSFLASSMC